MSEQKGRGSNFEERLLIRLKAVVAERGAAASGAPVAASPGPRRPRRPMCLVLAGRQRSPSPWSSSSSAPAAGAPRAPSPWNRTRAAA
jgi:hypothetical protein